MRKFQPIIPSWSYFEPVLLEYHCSSAIYNRSFTKLLCPFKLLYANPVDFSTCQAHSSSWGFQESNLRHYQVRSCSFTSTTYVLSKIAIFFLILPSYDEHSSQICFRPQNIQKLMNQLSNYGRLFSLLTHWCLWTQKSFPSSNRPVQHFDPSLNFYASILQAYSFLLPPCFSSISCGFGNLYVMWWGWAWGPHGSVPGFLLKYYWCWPIDHICSYCP